MILNKFGELTLLDSDYVHIKLMAEEEEIEIAEAFKKELDLQGINPKDVYSLTLQGHQLLKYNEIYSHIVCDFKFRNK